MNNENYQTKDLGLAATLTAIGHPIIHVDKSNPRRVIFLFDDSPELQEKVNQFWSQELLIPAAVLLEHIRLLKARIYG